MGVSPNAKDDMHGLGSIESLARLSFFFQCNSVDRSPRMQRVKGRRPSGEPSHWGGTRALFTISARSWAPLKQVMPNWRFQQKPPPHTHTDTINSKIIAADLNTS